MSRKYHRADKISDIGVSALCFQKPRAIGEGNGGEG